MHKYHNTASGLASLGRRGDSMLVHMTPGEVASLQKMAELKGGSLTINPHTGLPEAGFLKDFLPMIAGGITALFTGGMSIPMQMALQAGAGMAAGAATGKKGLAEILLSGAGGIGGAGVVGGLSKLGAGAATAAVPGATSTVVPAATAGAGAGAGAGAVGTNSIMQAAGLGGVPTPVIEGLTAFNQVPLGAAVTNLGTTAVPAAAAPSFGNAATGLGKVLYGSPEAAGFLGANKVPLMLSAAPMLAQEETELGGPVVKPTPHYNTKFNRRINPNYGKPGESMYVDSYGPGSFSKDYLYGSNLMPAPGEGQLASDSTLGSFDNPFGGSAPIGMKSGGAVHFDAGGTTGSGLAGMRDYYQNLMTPRAPAQPSGNDAHSAYLSSLAGTPFNPNFAPVPTSVDTPPPPPASTTPAIDTTASVNPFANRGRFIGGNPSYAYNPVTQSYSGGESPFDLSSLGNLRFAKGGLANLGGSYAAGGKLLRGGGDGMSDSIPAVIRGKKPQRAALADGEFVVPADVVSHLGNGSTEAGGRRLYAMMDRIRKARTGRKKQAPAVKAHKYLPA